MPEPKTELDPSLFEIKIRGTIVNQKQTKPADGDVLVLTNTMLIRVDSRDMDDVLALVVPKSELLKHNIPSRDDWIEALTDQSDNKFTWSNAYRDHMLRVRVSGKTIATFNNVAVTTFQFDVKQTILTCHVLAHKAGSEACGKVAEILQANVALEFSRAKHWSAQEEIPGTGKDEGDADAQTELSDEERKKVEKAKEVANQHNTKKARGRTK